MKRVAKYTETWLCQHGVFSYQPLKLKKKKKTGLNGYVYDFIVDHNAIYTINMTEIQKYLI